MMQSGTDALLDEEDSTHGALVRKMLDARSETLDKENVSVHANESKSQQKDAAVKEVLYFHILQMR